MSASRALAASRGALPHVSVQPCPGGYFHEELRAEVQIEAEALPLGEDHVQVRVAVRVEEADAAGVLGGKSPGVSYLEEPLEVTPVTIGAAGQEQQYEEEEGHPLRRMRLPRYARPMSPPRMVVVGCPSLDRVVVDGAIHDVIGGAGFLTAVAASAAGASVGLVALVPPSLPATIARVFGPGGVDRAGLTTLPGTLPSFHIVYDGRHDATYVQADAGMEARLVAADLPGEWLGTALVHVASIGGSTESQLSFIAGLRARGFRGLISAGTWSGAVRDEPELVGKLLTTADFFFLNRAEAAVIVPDGVPPLHRGVVCVTEGADGVVIHGGDVTRFRPPPADVVDPTGAGDSFCGGFLGATMRGLDGPAAGLALAAHSLGGWGGGPTCDLVAEAVAPRVRVDPSRIKDVGAALREIGEGSAFEFAGFPFPDVEDPHAVAIFAVATMHQYGFWTTAAGRWVGPMDAVAGGRTWRGSEFVWQACTRAAAADPTVFDPVRMASEPDLFDRLFADDDGRIPLPDPDSHRRLHLALGAAVAQRFPGGWSELLTTAQGAEDPTKALLDILATMPGYCEDPLAKKARLLALILGARPERFLGAKPQVPGAIVDYHLMRGCLRTGLVEVVDPELRARLEARTWVDEFEEDTVRRACSEALDRLEAASGLSVGEIDGFFFANGRKRCVQLQEPTCSSCPIQAACPQRTALFQPIFRTTFY